MLKPVPFANSLLVAGAAFYLFCAVLVSLAPDIYFAVLQSWSHGLDLSVAKPDGPMFNWGSLVLGLVTFSIFFWILGFIVASLYNKLSVSPQTSKSSR